MCPLQSEHIIACKYCTAYDLHVITLYISLDRACTTWLSEQGLLEVEHVPWTEASDSMTRVACIIIMHLRLQCTHCNCRGVYMAGTVIAYSVMRSAHYSILDSTQTLDTLKIL